MTPMLVQRPRADRAFERVYRQNVRHVYGYALAVLHSPEDAEDVTQATFLNAYRAYERGEFPRSPDNWLISIAHGLCDQRARQARLEAVAYEDQADEAVPEDEGPSPNDVRRALGRLPFDQRAALMMREVEGRSYAELVEILGVSNAEVESLLFRARRALREELDESSLTCHQAERAISRRLDALLGRAERKQLRTHLRECVDCARFARSQRTHRAALRALVNVPLPASLASFFAKSSGSRGKA
jgi:RNA polymerase sigma factor (sigma-70 family)